MGIRDWGTDTPYIRIPDALEVIYLQTSDGHEAAKLVMQGYDLEEDEYYLDDYEDSELAEDSNYNSDSDDTRTNDDDDDKK